eukprot:9101337-Alexandrium_andersonii.AAC.1
MSASLVGSEMCIRDRYRPLTLARTSVGSVWPGGDASSARTSAAASRSPVSYTHLTLPTICSV